MSKPRIEPVAWHPPAAPARAREAASAVPLPPLEIIDVGGTGPEDVLVGPDGAAYTGTTDGAVRRIVRGADGPAPPGATVEVVADTGGRPLGLEWLPDGRLLICDAGRGLLAADLAAAAPGSPVTEFETLATEAAGRRFVLCNNSAVGGDGTIWFTDSSARHGLEDWRADIFEHSGTGRLLRRDPRGALDVLAEGLQFANGVALAPDESAVYYAETGAYQVNRMWLTGERAGRSEVLVPNLPGFPDNISLGADGLIWIALASPRDRIVDLLAPAPPWLRRAAWATPDALQPKPKLFGWALAVDPLTGGVVHDLQGRQPGFGMSTGVREFADRVWLSSLIGTTVATFAVSADVTKASVRRP